MAAYIIKLSRLIASTCLFLLSTTVMAEGDAFMPNEEGALQSLEEDINRPWQEAEEDTVEMSAPEASLPAEEVSGSNTPHHFALLLPLSGALKGPGLAVRDGFMAAYNASVLPYTVDVRIYDTAKEGAAALYQKALAEGADCIVGPLTKPDVAAVAVLDHPVPTLFLNDIDMDNSHNVFRFGLSPSYEARKVAEKALEEGLKKALIIAPAGVWGDEVVNAFMEEWAMAEGQVIDRLHYDNNMDLTHILRKFLRVPEEKALKALQEKAIAQKTKPLPLLRRQDFDMIFLLAYPSKARQIMPLLKYYFAGDVPIYATSTAYAGSPNKAQDRDLDGLIFCDVPWVFSHVLPSKQWPETFNAYSRLYALGLDSYALTHHFDKFLAQGSSGISDENGVFYATREKNILRKLVFRQFNKGVAGKVCRKKLA